MKQQHTLMKIDPAFGTAKPFPSHAQQWRNYNGEMAWLFNPWTEGRRHPADVGSDPFGFLILPPDEPVYAGEDDMPSVALAMIREWRRGCSCAKKHSPEGCPECTRALIDSIDTVLSAAPNAEITGRAAFRAVPHCQVQPPDVGAWHGNQH